MIASEMDEIDPFSIVRETPLYISTKQIGTWRICLFNALTAFESLIMIKDGNIIESALKVIKAVWPEIWNNLHQRQVYVQEQV